MNHRQPACDPCRQAKLACGHERPVCARCRNREKDAACVYRTAPFKRIQRRRSSRSNQSLPRSPPLATQPSRYEPLEQLSVSLTSLILFSVVRTTLRIHCSHQARCGTITIRTLATLVSRAILLFSATSRPNRTLIASCCPYHHLSLLLWTSILRQSKGHSS
jgi:hypothetical protein